MYKYLSAYAFEYFNFAQQFKIVDIFLSNAYWH